MSRGVKFLLRLAMWLAVIAYIAVAVSFHSSTEKLCTGLEIRILDDQKFVDEDIVRLWLDTVFSPHLGKPAEELPLYEMEQLLRSKPYIQNVDLYSDIDGHCIVELSQRDVVFRVLSEGGHDFFVDTLGYRLNPRGVWQKDVPVITTNCVLPFPSNEYGFVDERYKVFSEYYLKNLRNFVKVLRRDQFLSGLVTQIRVTGDIKPGKESLHLIPRIGRQRIVLGDFSDIVSKLENVSLFYSKTYSDGWWHEASDVCFQYGDKIIIKRK